MKRSVILMLTTIILASCGGEEKTGDTAAQLATLKQERAKIDQQIMELEAIALKDNPEDAVPVSVVNLAPTDFKSYIEVQAAVTGDENVNATAQAPGVVTKVHVRAGQRVGAGQILATLDAAAVEQQIKAQEAQLTLAKEVYLRQQKLWAQNIGSEVQLLTSKANYESAQKQYESLQAQRRMYTITSPINGTVDAVNVKVGDATGPGMMGIRVVSQSKLKVETTLGENYIGKVSTGDIAILKFDGLEDIKTKLTYVSRSVDPVSRAFNVEVYIGNNKDIRPNMSCKMKIENYHNAEALVIPVSAVQNTAEGEMVFKVDNNTAKSVNIKTGRVANGMVEILEGLGKGDKIITEGYAEVDNGRTVEVL